MEATVSTLSEFHDRIQELLNDGESLWLHNSMCEYCVVRFDHEVNTAMLFNDEGDMRLPDAIPEAELDDMLNDLVLGHYYTKP